MKLVHLIITENDETTEEGGFMRFYMVFDEENMIYVHRPKFEYWKYQSPKSHHLAHVQKYATFGDAERAARRLQNECNKEIAHISPDDLEEKLRGKRPPTFVVREANIEIAGQKNIKTEKVKKVSLRGQVVRFTADDGRTGYLGGIKNNPHDLQVLEYLPHNARSIIFDNSAHATKFARGVPPEVIKKIKEKILGKNDGRYHYDGHVTHITKVEAVDVKDLIHAHGE